MFVMTFGVGGGKPNEVVGPFGDEALAEVYLIGLGYSKTNPKGKRWNKQEGGNCVYADIMLLTPPK